MREMLYKQPMHDTFAGKIASANKYRRAGANGLLYPIAS